MVKEPLEEPRDAEEEHDSCNGAAEVSVPATAISCSEARTLYDKEKGLHGYVAACPDEAKGIWIGVWIPVVSRHPNAVGQRAN